MILFSDLSPLWTNDIPAISDTGEFLQEIYASATLVGGVYVFDRFPLQVFSTIDDEDFLFYLQPLDDLTDMVQIHPTRVQLTNDVAVYYIQKDLAHPFETAYIGRVWQLRVEDTTYGSVRTSLPLMVTDCEGARDNTILLRYSNSSNVTPYNAAFTISGYPYQFEFRVPGGIKPAGFTPLLDNETFRNQRQEVVQLYGAAYGRHTLTLGDARGVPYYYAELLNRILTLDNVELYDTSSDTWHTIRRSENAVPQLAETYTGSGLFHVTQEIEIVPPRFTLPDEPVNGRAFIVKENEQYNVQ